MAQQQVNLNKCKGLYSFPNSLGTMPEGALVKAKNVSINRENVIEPVRGFKLYGTASGSSATTDVAKQLLIYKNRILRHYTTTLQYDNGSGTFANFSGNYSETESGLRIKGIEANGNFYFTTSTGIKKISAASAATLSSATIGNAGGLKALDGTATLNTTTGWFTQDSVVAYRILWGTRDNNNNLIYGTPSERIVISNPISDLLITDFNNLLTILDDVSNAGGINNASYVTELKIAAGSDASTIKTNLLALSARLDTDITITESIAVTNVVVASNVATLTFGSAVTTFFSIGDKIYVSGLTAGAPDHRGLNGYHTLTAVSGSTISFIVPTTTIASAAPSGTAAVKRLTYTTGDFRTNDETNIPISIAGVRVPTGTSNVAVRFSGDISSYVKVGDSVTFSGFLDTFTDLNDTYTVVGIGRTSSDNDTIEFTRIRTIVNSEDTSTNVTGASCVVSASERTLTLSDDVTTAQLKALQEYYDDIVTLLQQEPAGVVTDNSVFDSANSTRSATVDVTFTVPSAATTSWFYQVYRTPLTTSTGASVLSDLNPGDECQLVYEDFYASGTSVTVNDVTPEDFLGVYLYTNPNTGEGIAQANEVPPLAKDITLFKGYTFYANTQTKYRKNISLLSVDDLVSNTSTFTITDGTTTNTYTFVAGVAEVTTVTCVGDTADSLNGKYFTINSANNETSYYVWYKTSGGALSDPAVSGKTGIRVNITTGDSANTVASLTRAALNEYNDFTITGGTNQVIITNSEKGIATDAAANTSGFTVTVNTQGVGEDATNKKILLRNEASYTPSQQVDATARSLIRVVNKNSSELVIAQYLSGADDIPGLMFFEAKSLGGSAFYFTVNSTATGDEFSPSLPTSGNTVISDNEVVVNRIYYSKYQQPEAVPLLNYIDIGPKDKAIKRILALRDSLVVFKEEGIYNLSGEVAPFVVAQFDSSAILNAPDSAVILNNLIYASTSQGVVSVSDREVAVISRPIENLILSLAQYSNFDTVTVGVPYESERSYYLYTLKESTDDESTQCYVYNTFTTAWTVRDKGATCGVVYNIDDKMYIGATDTNYIEQERKNFDRTDHAGREISINIDTNSITDEEIIMGDITDMEVSDVIMQTQYVTIEQFNRLLLKLDDDNKLADSNYYSLWSASRGQSLNTRLDSVITKIANDSGRTGTAGATSAASYTALSPAPSSFSSLQSTFNSLTTLLNADAGVSFSNYETLSGTVVYEGIITDIDLSTKVITLDQSYPFISGVAVNVKHINCEVQWAPQFASNPSSLKHISETTIMFENQGFTTAKVEFATDLNPEFSRFEFSGDGNGSFGNSVFGATNFGGNGSYVPFRTYPPRGYQRCRFLNLKFKHEIAREKWSIFGISFTFRDTSTRAYK